MFVSERKRSYSQHPCGVFDFLRIGFDVSVVESTAIMHINLVIILEVHDKERNIASNRTLSPSIRAVVGAKLTVLFMFELAVVWENVMTTKNLVSAWKFQ